MEPTIEYDVQDRVALLRINRPQARNALNWLAQEHFAACVEQASRQINLRALIVTGTGDKAFAAGGDIKEQIDHPERSAGERLNRVMSDALAQLTELPFPVFAAVNGDAIGGGCEILTACDLRLAVASAKFRFAQVKVGLTTGWGGAARLVRLLGQSRALELLLTARSFGVQEAYQIGLIHRIAPADEDVVAVALNWAYELAALPREALAGMKQLVLAATRLSLPEVYQLETRLFTELWTEADHLEAMAAFVEKRPPSFT